MKMFNYLKKPKRILIALFNINFFWFLPDTIFLKIKYKLLTGKRLNLISPKSFNEKMQWLKINNRKRIYTTMVDKYCVKDYVANIIGKEYIIPTILVCDSFNEINFNELPQKFVIKCTHDSGGLVICKNKYQFNIASAKKKINHYLKRKYFYIHREWPYKNIKPRIIVEKYLENEKEDSLRDYKFHCFNGKVKYILVCSDRTTNLKETFFDQNWNVAPFKRPNHDVELKIKKPRNFNKMVELAEKLSKDMPFLRVDFYEVNKKIYFGELTFYPASGFSNFEPDCWDEKLGDMINLSMVIDNEK